MMSRAQSAKESAKVYETVKPVFDRAFGEGVVTHDILRKMAHFFEFFVLGLEIGVLFCLLKTMNPKWLAMVLPFGFLVGGIDETIQIFSKRGASFLDVLLDFSGYLLAIMLFYAVYYLIIAIKRKTKKLKKTDAKNI